MKERPILFSAPMVLAILEGRKTQTRRAVKPQGSILTDEMARSFGIRPPEKQNQPVIQCPYGQPGERLWLRETWRGIVQINAPHDPYKTGVARYVPDQEHCKRIEYLATQKPDGEPWKPSIHMPRWASRITLEITGIRVERLQDISEEDAESEGVDFLRHVPDADETLTAKQLFECLWSGINGAKSWDANPWIWVIEFKRVT